MEAEYGVCCCTCEDNPCNCWCRCVDTFWEGTEGDCKCRCKTLSALYCHGIIGNAGNYYSRTIALSLLPLFLLVWILLLFFDTLVILLIIVLAIVCFPLVILFALLWITFLRSIMWK